MSIEEAVSVADKLFHLALQRGLIGDFQNAGHVADALYELKKFPEQIRIREEIIAMHEETIAEYRRKANV